MKSDKIRIKFFISLIALTSILFASNCIANDSFCKGAVVMDIGVVPAGKIFLQNATTADVGPEGADATDIWAAGTSRWFTLDDTIANSGLAIAMTATSLGRQVKVVSVDGLFPKNGLIKALYLSIADVPTP